MREIRRRRKKERGSGNCWCYGLGPVVMKRSPGIVDAVESGTIRAARRADVEMEVIPTDQSGDVPCLFKWDERERGRGRSQARTMDPVRGRAVRNWEEEVEEEEEEEETRA